MPKYNYPEPLPPSREYITFAFAAMMAAVLIFSTWHAPLLLFPNAVIGFLYWKSETALKRRFCKMAQERQGQSIREFARFFDRKTVDPYIIRAVYEGLSEYTVFEGKSIPIMPEDNPLKDYQMDDDDLDLDLVEEIAFRTGRSLEGFDDNPLMGKVNTAQDLVMFFNHQPMQATAS